jgi:ABC-type amino acid transport system permease subunit
MSTTNAEKLDERFIRWQAALRETLASHVAFIVAFSSGGLAFIGVILDSDHAVFSRGTSTTLLVAGGAFLLSLLLALIISHNRLSDVRETLKILKHRREQAPMELIEQLRRQTDALGKLTWGAIYLQLGLFAIGAVSFVVGVYLAFEHRLVTH